MAVISVGDRALIGGTLCLPRIGVWHMDAVLDSPDQLSGAVTVKIGDDLTLNGTVHEGAPYTETGYYRIFGGSGGLSQTAKPAGYSQCQLRRPLTDLLIGIGEKLSAISTASVLNTQLTAWATLGVAAGRQLAALLQAAPANTAWRVLPSGEFWVGQETWPDANIGEYELMGRLPHEARAEITTERPTLLPGTTLAGGKISYVEHRIDASKLRTLVLLENF